MVECKYCFDEICVNADSPMCADYCPVSDTPDVCKWEDRTPQKEGGQIMNKYYKLSDGFFTYFVNVENGKKKFSLDENDVLVESDLDDFCR